ncbi:hypothetical protein CYY_009854 [Polysphondylium violaceum]|uniref:Chloride channel protein n=1 Tax=Polysphondylium violaceum TaxID=133409 RepID=A0A8J4PKZ8_9MYCE|nr:hypothetical protein CYY_009854 [Polysphondylium violaceum]
MDRFPTNDYLLLDVENGANGATMKEDTTLTHRRHHRKLTNKEKALMSKVESLDFSEIDNILLRQYTLKQKKLRKILKTFGKWLICTLIGLFTGIVVYCLKESVENLEEIKFSSIEKFYSDSIAIPFFIFLSFNLGYGVLSSLFVVLFGPLTSSSGLPEVKGYLNGIRIQKAFNLKTVIGKILSLIFSFSSALVLGPEGPMFHIGAAIGSSISQFKSKTLGIHLKSFWIFQNDSDKRDFISCGAAAGIAAAFGAPIGGVLFALEEGSSFWSRQLTWRTFFSCLIATLTANLFLQGFKVQIHDYGVLTFGVSKTYLYTYTELIPFVLMGIFGGLLGALFVHLNVRINYLRKKYLQDKRLKIVEVIVVVTITSFICFFPALGVSCVPISNIPDLPPDVCDISQSTTTVQFFCKEGYYNPLATLTFSPLEDALKILYSRSSHIFSPEILITFAVIYFLLCVITSGIYVASGIFIPMMLIGASWGRLVGILLSKWITTVDPSIYALIGSAAMMGGSLRMTISLVVIIVELTEGTQYLLPLIIVVMLSKWTGDAFNESVYEHLIELKNIPYLPSQPAHHLRKSTVADAMASDVKYFPEIVSVRKVVDMLSNTTHNGFPVVMIPKLHDPSLPTITLSKGSIQDDPNLLRKSVNNNNNNNEKIINNTVCIGDEDIDPQEGKILVGLILASQLSILLKRKIFIYSNQMSSMDLIADSGMNLPISHSEFSAELAGKIPSISDIKESLTSEDLDKMIDLRPYMNFAVVSIKNYSSLTEAYRIFRVVGLRHIVVVNVFNQIVGMLTRKDLL